MMKHRSIGTLACIFALGIFATPAVHGEEQGGGKKAAVMKTMHETANALVGLRTQEYRAGMSGIGEVLAAQRKLHEVELKLASHPGERRKVLVASLRVARETEKFAETRVENGTASQSEVLEARIARLQAELLLLENGG